MVARSADKKGRLETSGKRLTRYILDNRERAVIQITKFIECDDMKEQWM
jgi:hypothetical protein